MILSYIYLILVTLYSLVTIYNLIKIKKELNFLNPFFLILILFILYFVVPSFSAQEIRYYYNWTYTDNDILYSNLLITNILLIFTYLSSKINNLKLKYVSKIKVSKVLKLIWLFVFMYLVYILYLKFSMGILQFNDEYRGVQDIYKLKNIAYLLLPVSILYFSETKNFFVFTPNLLLAILDMLDGSRTVALIVLVPIFLSLSIYNKKLYLLPISIIISMFLLVGIFRAESGFSNVPVYIDAIGEVRETYIPLPLLIGNEDFIGHGDIYNLLSRVSVVFIQPLREEILNSTKNAARYIVKFVSRGYGQGSNLIIDALYYGYIWLIIFLIYLVAFSFLIFKIIQKVPIAVSIIIMSYFIIFMRLGFREGIFFNTSLMLFIMLIYYMPISVVNNFFNKLNVKGKLKYDKVL